MLTSGIQKAEGRACYSVVDCLFSMSKALSFITSIIN